MASEVFINIKNLPETDQINDGDFLIVETLLVLILLILRILL